MTLQLNDTDITYLFYLISRTAHPMDTSLCLVYAIDSSYITLMFVLIIVCKVGKHFINNRKEIKFCEIKSDDEECNKITEIELI